MSEYCSTARPATHIRHSMKCTDQKQSTSASLRRKSFVIYEAQIGSRNILRLVSLSTTRHNTCYILSNALFAAGTTFLMVSTRNESSKQTVERASVDSGQCIRLMLDFPTSASRVGHDIMQRLCKEWDAPPQETMSKKAETIKLLNDANSDMVKLLKELGWQRPVTPAPVMDNVTENIGLADFLGGDSFASMTSNPMDIETYDRECPNGILRKMSSSRSSTGLACMVHE